MLSKSEFEVMTLLEKEGGEYSRRSIAKTLKYSLGKAQNVLKILEDNDLVQHYALTNKGINALSPYRVRRGVIMAAGKGSRLYPLTLDTPKPLIRVNGKMLVETVIDALIKAEITDITIVVGYLKEKFTILKEKYPFLKFVVNDEYNTTNNISSAMKVKDLFASAYILDADLIINSDDVITKYQYASNYVGIKVDSTDDWCLCTKNGIVRIMKRGGENVYLMREVVYYSEEDGKMFLEDIEKVYSSLGGKERYHDEVALDVFKNNYKFYIRPIHENDVLEIDSLDDLKKIDKSYANC